MRPIRAQRFRERGGAVRVAALYQRDDDKEETVAARLEVYFAQTAPLIDYYAAKGVLRSVDGMKSVDDVFASIEKVLD